jgi:membrane protein
VARFVPEPPRWATTGPIGRLVDLAVATWRRVVADRMADGAASLAYYLLLSLIPSLLIFGVVLKILGREAADDVADFVRDSGASASLASTVRGALDTAVASAPEGAGAVGLVGLGTLVYGASRAFTAAGRALDVIAGRTVVARSIPRRAQDIGWTVVLIVLVLVLVALVFLTGGLVRRLSEAVGLGDVGTLAWDLARWPAAFLLGLAIVALVVWAAPSQRPPGFRAVTPGTLFTVSAFLLASAGYGLYVANIGDYNATYGAFAALVILMLWVWIGSIAFLFGAELDAELSARRR